MKNQGKLCQESQLFFAQSQDRKGLCGPPAYSRCSLLQCQGSLTPLLSGMRKKDLSTAEQAEFMRERSPQSQTYPVALTPHLPRGLASLAQLSPCYKELEKP